MIFLPIIKLVRELFISNMQNKFEQDTWKTSVSLYRVIGYHVTLWESHMIANHPIYGVIGYHVTLSEGHMIANHPI